MEAGSQMMAHIAGDTKGKKGRTLAYRIDLGARSVSLAGLVLLAVGGHIGWAWGALLGGLLWAFLFITCVQGAVNMLYTNPIELIRTLVGSRRVRTPVMAKVIAARFGIDAPKEMRITPRSDFNASVSGNILYVTAGFRPLLWATPGAGVMAHEMAHLARRHQFQRIIVLSSVLMLTCMTLFLLGTNSWQMGLAIGLTIFSVIPPVVFRYQEYDADTQAARVVGVYTMASALRILADKSRWHIESETHPSIGKRLAHLSKRSRS